MIEAYQPDGSCLLLAKLSGVDLIPDSFKNAAKVWGENYAVIFKISKFPLHETAMVVLSLI